MRILIFICLCGLSSASKFSDGPCPVRPVIPKLDNRDLAGIWYEIKKLANGYDRGFECSTTSFSSTGNKTYDATRCEKHNGFKHCDHYKIKQVVEEGIFLPEDNNRSKVINFLFSNFSI